jgi:hypothetical protein
LFIFEGGLKGGAKGGQNPCPTFKKNFFFFICMKKRFEIILTSEQEKQLENKAKQFGFSHKSEYIRFLLFMETSVIDKINAIYEKVVNNG